MAKKYTSPELEIKSLWLAENPSKRWGEIFFLAYSPFWIITLLGVVVPLGLYERFQELEYLVLGLLTAAPCIVFPFFIVSADVLLNYYLVCSTLFPGLIGHFSAFNVMCRKTQRNHGICGIGSRMLMRAPCFNNYIEGFLQLIIGTETLDCGVQVTFEANVWVAIFGFVGNYFWTHYFFVVLGAIYTFPSYKINHVPITTFLLTQPYFLLYHTISNMTLRRLGHAIKDISDRRTRWLIQACWILVLSYITALTEALTISQFPYYEMVDRVTFYKVGSMFYACYFIVSFPMFKRMDEDSNAPWTLPQVIVDALGASMLVTIILDLWRIIIGPIVDIPWAASQSDCLQYGPPWLKPTSETKGVKDLYTWKSTGVSQESYMRSKFSVQHNEL